MSRLDLRTIKHLIRLSNEITAARLSRRELATMGLLAGWPALLKAQGDFTPNCLSPAEVPTVSPPTRPWLEELPIPLVAKPVATLDPAPTGMTTFFHDHDPHGDPLRVPVPMQRFHEFPPQKFYEIHVRETLHSFHPDLPKSPVWGYDGIVPGPTFHAHYGEPILVRFHNDLRQHCGAGSPEISIHLHNGHNAAESDGHPLDYFHPGQFKDYHYPNILAGYDEFLLRGEGPGNPLETLSTLWYHDHRNLFTAANVYKGMAGFYLLFSEIDSGNEQDTNPKALRLPSGKFDVPLLIADKVFDENGIVFFDQLNLDGVLGDKLTVNGKIQPFFRVARRKYRFRILNGSTARFLNLALSRPGDFNQPFVVVSVEGNLIPNPIGFGEGVREITVAPAERYDVIIDFSRYPLGQELLLQNRLLQTSGRGPVIESNEFFPIGRLVGGQPPILKFIVDREAIGEETDESQVPAQLLALPARELFVFTRLFRFDRQNGMWTINGKTFEQRREEGEAGRVQVQKGSAEQWTLKNDSGGWSHPVHIHMEEFQMVTRNGIDPFLETFALTTLVFDVGREDTLKLGPNEEVVIFMRFRDFEGRYVMHCHNTVHEDHDMMLEVEVRP